MRKRMFSDSDVARMLNDVDRLIDAGHSATAACRQIGISQQSYYRWRKEYGGLKMDQAKRLKELERENTRLRKAVADLTLDKQVLAEVAKGNF